MHSPHAADKNAAQRNADGLDHMAWGHWKKAAADFRRAVEADPNLAEAHFNLALALHAMGNGPEASTHFQMAKTLAPGDPRIIENPILETYLNPRTAGSP